MAHSPQVISRGILDVVPTIMRVIRSEMRNQHPADLAVPQFRALLFIRRNPGSSLLSVANHLGLTSATVSKMIDGMVADLLVQRESSPEDRRKLTLVLTPQGKAILEKATQGTQARLAEILSQLTPEQGETVFNALKLLHPLFSGGRKQAKGKVSKGKRA